jgi:hypothetical protein
MVVAKAMTPRRRHQGAENTYHELDCYSKLNPGGIAMQIRCSHCHRPFALGKEAVHASLDAAQAENLAHINTQCPHCGRSNRVSRQELQRAAPDWTPSSQAETSGDRQPANDK